MDALVICCCIEWRMNFRSYTFPFIWKFAQIESHWSIKEKFTMKRGEYRHRLHINNERE